MASASMPPSTSRSLCMQCEKLALEKYGDFESIEEHRKDLLGIRQQRRTQRRLDDQKKVSSLASRWLSA